MNRREESKQETRRLIMQAARKLLREKEVGQCTMRAIAKEAGVSPASVVVHFKNKAFLLEAALTDDIERNTVAALERMPEAGELAERLAPVWRTYFEFYDDKRDLYRVLIRSTVFEPEDQTPYMTAQTEAFLRCLAELITAEVERGQMSDQANPEALSFCLFSIYFCTLIMFFRNPAMTPEEATQAVLAMNKQTLNGWSTRPV